MILPAFQRVVEDVVIALLLFSAMPQGITKITADALPISSQGSLIIPEGAMPKVCRRLRGELPEKVECPQRS